MLLLIELGGPLIIASRTSLWIHFSKDLLPWLWQFRNNFTDKKDWCSVIWNNKDIKINGKPVFYKIFFHLGIYSISDDLFNLSNIESYIKKLKEVYFLTWIGPRHAIPFSLKKICGHTKGVPSFKYNGNIFEIMKYKSKGYYSLIISNKAQLPNNTHKLT